jgi:pimeloyl-ACP methyl ester carboxylesterase
MAVERVTFANARGEQLVGVLHGGPGEAAVISCHGMLSNKDGTKHQLLAELLTERGLPVLRFDGAGRGESEGSLAELSYSHGREDVAAALAYLAVRGVGRFGLFGSSMGGALALLAASREERVVAVATLAAVAHPGDLDERHPELVRAWQTQGFVDTELGRIGRGYYDDASQHDVIAAVRVLRAPLLVLHGEEDDVVPVSDAHDIASAARDVTLEIVLGADHRFSKPVHLRPAMRAVADFLVAHVAGPGALARGNEKK